MDARLVAYLHALGADPSCLDGWTVSTAQRAGVDVAFVISKGPELHFVAIDGKSAMSRKNILQFMGGIIAQFGYCTTRVPVTETNHKLRLSLGFVRSWADERHSYWVATELPYQKGNQSCQLQS